MVPTARLPRVLERIDYALYYQRRKKGIVWSEGICKSFAEFAATRKVGFPDDYVFPSRETGKLAKLTDAQREIVTAFWIERPDIERVEADEDEEEETK